ncbi:MAG: nucleotidyltransferase domain-containing protein [Thermoplasmatota archaeon]
MVPLKRASLDTVRASPPFKAALAEFLQGLSPHASAIDQVVLFGSIARGEGSSKSDVDLLVLWRGPLEDARNVLAALSADVLISTGIHVSAHAITPAEYRRMGAMRTAFFEAVDREGLIVA